MGKENIRVEPMAVRWLGPEVSEIKAIADVASSLNNKYFLINSAKDADKYYVWLNVGAAGVDPAIAGRTAVEVALTVGASKEAVAQAIVNALNALTGKFNASAVDEVITIRTKSDGVTTATVDGTAATGFTFRTVSKGADVDLGLIQGDISLSFAQDNYEVKAQQTGTQILDRINTGTNLEAIQINLLETHAAMLKSMMGAMGEAYTPAAGSEVIGIGTSRRFSVMSTLGKKLVLHPIRLTSTDRSKDLCFWCATPQVSGLNFSGENASVLGVEFLLAMDETKVDECNLSVLGDWQQDFDKAA